MEPNEDVGIWNDKNSESISSCAGRLTGSRSDRETDQLHSFARPEMHRICKSARRPLTNSWIKPVPCSAQGAYTFGVCDHERKPSVRRYEDPSVPMMHSLVDWLEVSPDDNESQDFNSCYDRVDHE